jgi:hypothetical protein
MAIDIDMLIGGIIALVVGIILYAIIRYIPPGASTIAKIVGIILAILGVILILLSFILPLVGYYS